VTKRSFIFLLLTLSFFSCFDKEQKNELAVSTGKINSLSIIINDQLWDGEIGDSLRKKFAAPVDGLLQEEPLFTINQYPLKALEGNKILSRNLIIVRKGEKNNYQFLNNEFATPQNSIHISGNKNAEILEHIEKNAEAIIKSIKKSEIVENQKKFQLSSLNDQKIRKKFKISLTMPSGFKYVLERQNFVWLKRDFLSGNNSILIYTAPFKTILKSDDLTNNIISLRDSMVGKYIRSKVRNSKMITEESYAPYFLKTILNNKRCWETKGTWEIKGDYMSGSFINYAIMDRKKRRFMIIEGFCYAPSIEKRDLMFELESILKSVKFLK
jgi:hypothetical protein